MATFPFLVVFALSWWLSFFFLLPLGITIEENPQKGNVLSAPEKPRILLKIAGATIIAGIVTVGYAWLV